MRCRARLAALHARLTRIATMVSGLVLPSDIGCRSADSTDAWGLGTSSRQLVGERVDERVGRSCGCSRDGVTGRECEAREA